MGLMKRTAIKCPGCGASASGRGFRRQRTCEYCGIGFQVESQRPRPLAVQTRNGFPATRKRNPIYYVYAVVVFGIAISIFVVVLTKMASDNDEFQKDRTEMQKDFEKSRKEMRRDFDK